MPATAPPLAPAFNPARFTNATKVEKWFGRNCKDVVGRDLDERFVLVNRRHDRWAAAVAGAAEPAGQRGEVHRGG
jgi:hypothetical protein